MSKKYENMSLVTGEIKTIQKLAGPDIMQNPVVVAALKEAGFVFDFPLNEFLIKRKNKVWHIMDEEAGPLYADLDSTEGRFYIGYDETDADLCMVRFVFPDEKCIVKAIYQYHYSVKRDVAYKTACANPSQLNLNILEALIKQAFKLE